MLIDFSVIDFPSVSNQSCGLAGEIPPDLPSDEGMGGNHPRVPPVPCSNHTNNVTCCKNLHWHAAGSTFCITVYR